MLYLNMINFPVDKKLSIILSNTNKALAQVLKDASPKELENMSKGKDLKSILNSLLKESAQNPSADKTLLKLLKENPTLKELGNVSQNMKELLSSLKSDKNLQPIQKMLEKFLPNIKELSNTNIKPTLENSGVFLESKLKNLQNPQVTLTKLLKDLSTLVEKSKIPNAKVINTQIKELLSSPTLKGATNEAIVKNINDNPKALQNIAKDLQTILGKVSYELKQANPILTPAFENKLTKLEYLLLPKSIDTQNVKLQQLKEPIQPKNIDIQSIKLPELKESIQQITQSLQNSFTKESKGFLDALNKILNTIQTIEQNQIATKTPTAVKTQVVVQELVQQKVPDDIKNIVENIKTVIKNADPLFSKSLNNIVKDLSSFAQSDKLSAQQHVKEVLSNDLKAILHKANEEVLKLSPQNQGEITKQLDKLAVQIDYHQLVSHLSNASSLYIPFSWEQMQEGNITIKHYEKDKFYCDIDLKLKDYGELKLRLILYDKNQLNLLIDSDNEEFKSLIKENIPMLRKALIDSNITPREIRFFNKSKTENTSYETEAADLDIGFEVKV